MCPCSASGPPLCLFVSEFGHRLVTGRLIYAPMHTAEYSLSHSEIVWAPPMSHSNSNLTGYGQCCLAHHYVS
jgi:hypothetical protein